MEREPFTRAQRRLAFALSAVVTVIALETMSVATVLPLVKRDLGQLSLYGWVGAAFTLTQLVGDGAIGSIRCSPCRWAWCASPSG